MARPTGYLLVVLAALCLGLNSILVKFLYIYGLSSLQVLLVQHVLAAGLLWLFAFFNGIRSLSLNTVSKLFVLGAGAQFFTALLFYKAISSLGAGLATALLFTFPAYVVISAALFYRETVTRIQKICLVFAIFGCALAVNVLRFDLGDVSLLGAALGCGAAVGCAFIHSYSQHILREIDPLTVSTYVTSFAALPLLMIQNPLEAVSIGFNGSILLLLVGTAVFASFLPPILMFTGIKIIGASKASIIGTVELPFTIILALVLLNEKFLVVQGIGAVLIFASAIMLQLEEFGYLKRKFSPMYKM